MEKNNLKLDAKKVEGLTQSLLKARKNNLKQAQDVAHRLELVREFKEVEYINDSKATDIEAVFYSLTSMVKPVVWIMEVNNPNKDFSSIKNLVRQKVKAIICVGDNKETVIDQLLDEIKLFVSAVSIEEAVNFANIYSTVGEVVLFSPSSPTDQKNGDYKLRGENFKNAVIQLNQ
jgi:UDP-N-acetylmuramoylalanine--D-glutamate ligase